MWEPLHVVRRAGDGTVAKDSFLTSTTPSSHKHPGPLGAAREGPGTRSERGCSPTATLTSPSPEPL